ncbi:MAG: histidine kinase, partial [Calditrichaeota bacterium]
MKISRKCHILIRVLPEEVPEGETLYITGNHRLLGNWNPSAVALRRQPDGSWSREFTFRRHTTVEFKVTRGSWQTEAADATGRPLDNYRLRVQRDDTITLKVPRWRDQVTNAPPPEERIRGTVRFHRRMEGEGLLPRDVIVWLPPGYEEDARRRYPVLYMHDGQNLFDPQTAYTGVDWEVDETATRLIEEGKIEAIIIVGVYNTVDRVEEYSLSPKGERYRRFLIRQLKPFIDQTYRTRPEREHTATLGSSMGGLVSFLLGWYHAEVFSGVGCMSPSFIYRKGETIKALKSSLPPAQPIRLYMDCGGVGGERLLYRGCKRVRRILRQKGLVEGKDFLFYYDPEADHSEQAWGARLWRPL